MAFPSQPFHQVARIDVNRTGSCTKAINRTGIQAIVLVFLYQLVKGILVTFGP
ncbi:hypothetical protein D3C86_2126570 [compost metagenome]